MKARVQVSIRPTDETITVILEHEGSHGVFITDRAGARQLDGDLRSAIEWLEAHSPHEERP